MFKYRNLMLKLDFLQKSFRPEYTAFVITSTYSLVCKLVDNLIDILGNASDGLKSSTLCVKLEYLRYLNCFAELDIEQVLEFEHVTKCHEMMDTESTIEDCNEMLSCAYSIVSAVNQALISIGKEVANFEEVYVNKYSNTFNDDFVKYCLYMRIPKKDRDSELERLTKLYGEDLEKDILKLVPEDFI